MKKRKSIILKILLITILFLFAIFINTSEASFWSDIFAGGDNFIEAGRANEAYITTSDGNRILAPDLEDKGIKDIINDIYSILFSLGVVATVMVGGILGIKFMLASAEDKAKVKESMVPYVIGCIVIYGAFGIWKICIQIFSVLS